MQQRKCQYWRSTSICCFPLAVLLLVIGIIILATNFERYVFDVSWSMGLGIAAAFFFLLAGIMASIPLCR